MILIKLSFILSSSINLTDFLKLRNFYFDLVLRKGYLPYKIITYQNVSSDVQVKKLFHFVEKLWSIPKILYF